MGKFESGIDLLTQLSTTKQTSNISFKLASCTCKVAPLEDIVYKNTKNLKNVQIKSNQSTAGHQETSGVQIIPALH